MNTQVKIIKNVLANGVRFDLVMNGMPEKFLGLAADLKFDGKGKYLRMDLSDSVNALPFAEQPIKMLKPADDRLVMGLTFKSNQLPQLRDGVLASFWFEGDKDFAGFEQQVFSVYGSGGREDLAVSWGNGQSVVTTLKQEKLPAKPKSVAELTLAAPLSDQLVETNLNQMDLAGIFAGESEKGEVEWDVNGVIIGLALLMGVAVVYLFNKVLKKSNLRLPSLTSSGI